MEKTRKGETDKKRKRKEEEMDKKGKEGEKEEKKDSIPEAPRDKVFLCYSILLNTFELIIFILETTRDSCILFFFAHNTSEHGSSIPKSKGIILIIFLFFNFLIICTGGHINATIYLGTVTKSPFCFIFTKINLRMVFPKV